MKAKCLISLFAAVLPYLQSAALLFVRVTIGWGFFLTGRASCSTSIGLLVFSKSLHLPAARFQAMLAGSTEMIGGVLLLLGLGTRVVSVPLAFTMVVAYLTAHRDEAFLSLSGFTDQAPFPFLMAVIVTMAFGAGKISLDQLLATQFDKFKGPNRVTS